VDRRRRGGRALGLRRRGEARWGGSIGSTGRADHPVTYPNSSFVRTSHSISWRNSYVAWPQKEGQGRQHGPFTVKGDVNMSEIVIYQKPTCSTCRMVIKLVEESGLPFTAINYYEKPFSKSKLKGLLKKAGLKSSDVIRKKEDIYKRLNLVQSQFTDDELLDIMIKQPDLIQRPLVQKGDQVILARPPETVKQLL
jgi:arsenate reductase